MFVDIKDNQIHLVNRWTPKVKEVIKFHISHVFMCCPTIIPLFLQVDDQEFLENPLTPADPKLEGIFLNNYFLIGQYSSNFVIIWSLQPPNFCCAMVFCIDITK